MSYGSVPLMLPIPTDDTKTDSARNKINCDRGDYGEPVLKFTSSDFGEGITFTSVPDEDINPQDRESAFRESGQMKEVDPLLLRMETVLKTHYREHEIARRMLEPWYDPPSANNINCFYGIDLDTVANYKYRANANTSDDVGSKKWVIWEQTVERGDSLEIDVGVVQGATKDASCSWRQSGDGTVPYRSLSWCHHWMGETADNVLRRPNGVRQDYNESGKIKEGFIEEREEARGEDGNVKSWLLNWQGR